MTEFTSHAPGTPCWVDLMTDDIAGSKQFYTSLFGWTHEDQFDDSGDLIYTMFAKGGKSVAGMGQMPPGPPGMPPTWNTYISVEDPDATAKAVTAAGGTVIMPPMTVMTAGSMAVFADPTGAVFSVWKPDAHFGVELGNEPDTYSWNELMTRDTSAAKDFYTQVFGWTYLEMDMGPSGIYSVIAGGDNDGLGGIMTMPGDVPEMVPNHWMVYFAVSDLDASLGKVTGASGQVVVPPTQIPGIGVFAIAHDPTGGSFALLQPAEPAQ